MANEYIRKDEESVSLQLAKQYLGKEVTVTVDRALGSSHPKHGFVYPVNYGYLEGVRAPDGEDLDAYVLGVHEPLASFTGRCVAIVHRHNDDDDKLVVVPKESTFSKAEIAEATRFQEQWFESDIIMHK